MLNFLKFLFSCEYFAIEQYFFDILIKHDLLETASISILVAYVLDECILAS